MLLSTLRLAALGGGGRGAGGGTAKGAAVAGEPAEYASVRKAARIQRRPWRRWRRPIWSWR